MSEQQGTYEAETQEAMEMLGAGYEEQYEAIGEAPDLRKYRTELPNLIDDANLTPFEFRLLVHYYRVGNCWQSVRTTAKKTHMSVPMVIKTRDSLEAKGWIYIKGQSESGTINIHAIDKWKENFEKYSGGVHKVEHPAKPHEQGVHKVEPKNNPIKKLKKHTQKEGGRPDFSKLQSIKDYRTIPELALFMDATDYTPGTAVLESVYDYIHDNQLTGEAIAKAKKEWAFRGYKLSNIAGYLEWAKNGIPPAYAPRQKPSTGYKPAQTNFEKTKAILAQYAEAES